MTGFVHLRLHTEYSLVDSVVRVPELMRACRASGMAAVALSDECNLFAMVKFYKAALEEGLKPLIGVDTWLRESGERAAPSRLTFLCQDLVGYRNLTRLVTKSYLAGSALGRPLIERAWLEGGQLGGLVVLSGGIEGDVGRSLLRGRASEAERLIDGWQALLGDRYYLEVARTGRAGEEDYIGALRELLLRRALPLVAVNDVRFLRREEFESHEARVCIHDGTLLTDPGRPRRYSEEQYLKSPAEMAELFADLPGACEQTVEIARRCSLALALGKSYLPEYPVPAGLDVDAYLAQEANLGLNLRLAAHAAGRPRLKDVPRAAYGERLATELDCISRMGFAGYFLIVADFIRWARANQVPVGPGRGSGAGSLVAYALRITDLDPLEHDLLFERFLNPERVSMPDFDVDFCMAGRDRVIEYVAAKYGRDRVSQIITYSTMAAKAVVRDVGRVLGQSYGAVDRIAKLVPFELDMTLDKALEKEEELRRIYESDEPVRELIDLARSIEGLTRGAGMHAGGVVIAPSLLTDFTPLYAVDGGASVVTQFDKDDVEAAGLVKFDFLGLRTLTVLDWAVQTIAERAGEGSPVLDLEMLPLDDAPTYELLKSCRTTAVFQLESRGMKDLVRRLQPDRFEEIVALVALFRPGPLQSGMVDDFINRKHGRGGRIDYLHPSLEPLLKDTYGVILYQEQVMQIAQVLAGYTLGSADLLRRAMGKKMPEEMAKQRSIFVAGSVARGVSEPLAAHIFDLMEKFAGYGFNKSHSAAYAMLSYQTAWLKAHHPAAYMAAVLSSDMDKTDKVVTFIDEARTIGLEVLPPDINESAYRFTVRDDRTIRYGLGAVKGVGEGAVEFIVQERARRGPYTSLPDLCRRIDLGKINRRTLEALIRSGCLDLLGPNRATLMARLPAAVQLGEQNTRASSQGQVDLFGLGGESAATPVPLATPLAAVLPDWPTAQRLAGERETLGLYLTGHPVAEFARELGFLASGRIADIAAGRPVPAGEGRWAAGRAVTVAGLVLEVKRRGNRTSLVLDDASGRLEVSLFDEVFQTHRELVMKDVILVVEGNLRFVEFNGDWQLAARRLLTLDQAREAGAKRLLMRLPAASSAALGELESVLRGARGGRVPVAIFYATPEAQALLTLGPDWGVRPTRVLLEQLTRLGGSDAVRLVYNARDEQACLAEWGARGEVPSTPLALTG
jgi:DNA polymerase-3 subunit alpha